MGGITENEKGRHLPCLFFFKKKEKNKGTIVPKTFFMGVRGDPGGSILVSYDTKQTTEQETPLTFSYSVYFLYLPVTVPTLSHIWDLHIAEMPISAICTYRQRVSVLAFRLQV